MSDTVLVVDDDLEILKNVVDVLEGEGYRVLSASNGVEALKHLALEKPCAILLDMRMPQMDGWGFAAEMKGQGLTIPIMVMTAAQNAARWCAEIGAHSGLAKPFGVDALVAGVQQLCRGANVMGHKILLVDDDAELRQALKLILQEEGYDVLDVCGIPEAVQSLSLHSFDLVLSDAFARSAATALVSLAPLRNAALTTPIGVLSGWNIESAPLTGLAFVLRKPASLDEVLGRIAGVLNGRDHVDSAWRGTASSPTGNT